MDKDSTWVEIKDDCVRHIWKKDCDCKNENGPETAEISPDWYQQNGTPSCGCGRDMVYVRTEILT